MSSSSLSREEWAEIEDISREIMTAVMAGSVFAEDGREAIRIAIMGIIGQRVIAANNAYEAVLSDEMLHEWEFGEHHIIQCSRDWCGRYRGQRRDSTEATS